MRRNRHWPTTRQRHRVDDRHDLVHGVIIPRRREEPISEPRESVVRLISEGVQTKQIEAKLFIFERTVDTHVRSVHRLS
jgi:DNA-binding NarL/FixJ family response regulator